MDRPTAALEKMKDCLQHDSCGEWDCVYFANFKELQCVLAWVEELEEAYLVSCESMQYILSKSEYPSNAITFFSPTDLKRNNSLLLKFSFLKPFLLKTCTVIASILETIK